MHHKEKIILKIKILNSTIFQEPLLNNLFIGNAVESLELSNNLKITLKILKIIDKTVIL